MYRAMEMDFCAADEYTSKMDFAARLFVHTHILLKTTRANMSVKRML